MANDRVGGIQVSSIKAIRYDTARWYTTRYDTIRRSCERCGQEYADGGINIVLAR